MDFFHAPGSALVRECAVFAAERRFSEIFRAWGCGVVEVEIQGFEELAEVVVGDAEDVAVPGDAGGGGKGGFKQDVFICDAVCAGFHDCDYKTGRGNGSRDGGIVVGSASFENVVGVDTVVARSQPFSLDGHSDPSREPHFRNIMESVSGLFEEFLDPFYEVCLGYPVGFVACGFVEWDVQNAGSNAFFADNSVDGCYFIFAGVEASLEGS